MTIPVRCAVVLLLFGAALAVPGVAGAVTDGDFEVKTTRNLLNLCTVSADDARYKEALHFCHGYLVGAFHYYVASVSGPNAKRLVCPPDPPPTRNAAIAAFIVWAQAHSQYMGEAPVETEFRFLTETYPCKR
jgi:Ssp1 endopeptidase immunity protein Rap1a